MRMPMQPPYPHILAGKSEAEVEMFLRDELVGEKELGSVINQLRDLGKKESIMAKVEGVLKTEVALEAGFDLKYDNKFSPKLKEIHSGNVNLVQQKVKKLVGIRGNSLVRVEKALNVQ